MVKFAADWYWFPASLSPAEKLAASVHGAIQRLPASHLAVGLLNRLDVSKYYVIPTIIILDATVEGN